MELARWPKKSFNDFSIVVSPSLQINILALSKRQCFHFKLLKLRIFVVHFLKSHSWLDKELITK